MPWHEALEWIGSCQFGAELRRRVSPCVGSGGGYMASRAARLRDTRPIHGGGLMWHGIEFDPVNRKRTVK
jgi:hypothetical protein